MNDNTYGDLITETQTNDSNKILLTDHDTGATYAFEIQQNKIYQLNGPNMRTRQKRVEFTAATPAQKTMMTRFARQRNKDKTEMYIYNSSEMYN